MPKIIYQISVVPPAQGGIRFHLARNSGGVQLPRVGENVVLTKDRKGTNELMSKVTDVVHDPFSGDVSVWLRPLPESKWKNVWELLPPDPVECQELVERLLHAGWVEQK